VSAENSTPETPQASVSGFKRLRYKLEFFGLKFVEAFVPRLPYSALRPLANALGFVFFHIDSRGRAVAIENLRVALGSAHTPAERSRIARKSCQNFARTMLCLFWSPNLTPENYQNYIRVEGLDNHPIHRDKNAPGVYFLTHFSNFEWISLASSFAVTPGPRRAARPAQRVRRERTRVKVRLQDVRLQSFLHDPLSSDQYCAAA
jgi:lauroyl/myristoyl acyltransferase